MEKILESLKAKRILILGFGREGKSTLAFFKRYFPDQKVDISDKQIDGPSYLHNLRNYDVIIKTPGIAKTPEIEQAEHQGVIITSQTKLFFSVCRDRIIGVTGTKGKSTTASLITHVLKNAGSDVVLVGNIGIPPLDFLETDHPNRWYVFELSAHQLADVTQSPHIGVFLNIFREHLDYYRSFEEYHSAKQHITTFQTSDDFFIFNNDQSELRETAGKTKAKSLGFSQTGRLESICTIDHAAVVSRYHEIPETIIPIKDIPLLGVMNQNNVMAAVLVAQIVGIEPQKIDALIQTFAPLPYRLEKVGVYNDIHFYDDALATIPEATMAALQSLPLPIDTLIAGGFDRGQDFHELASIIVKEHINNLILFPSTGERILQELQHTRIQHFLVTTMEEAVRLAYRHTTAGRICLLSAASPSFGLFKDYQDRSDQYRNEIKRQGDSETARR